MVTKAKAPPEEAETETTDEKPVTKSEVVEIVKEAVAGLLPTGEPKADGPATDEPATDDGKVVTAREEEARSHNLVMEAIKEFKKEFAGEDDTKSEKKEPEAEPGKKPTPWIQRVMWGIE